MILTTDAVVLHSRKYSDTSAILSLYTAAQGKISVIAKGARKPRSKFGSAVQPLSVMSATYYYKPGRDLHTLSNAENVLYLRTVASSFPHLSVALAIAETVSNTQHDAEQNTALFDVLRDTLAALDAAEKNLFGYFASFNIRVAELMGFMIDFSSCADTQTPIVAEEHPEYYFSFADGAPLQPDGITGGSGYRLGANALGTLQRIALSPTAAIEQIDIDALAKSEIQNFFGNYFSYHLERRFVYRTESITAVEYPVHENITITPL
ncbi:MAG: DNA repair protein RecO [Candidatus Kapabacteria bacterium]|nr:DNA repair protein RecO [Candidatus Kapabacteria bacterium]